MHLKRHHKKYLFGAFGWFALVKMVLLFFWLHPISTFAQVAQITPHTLPADDTWVILTPTNVDDYCKFATETEFVCAGTDYNQYDIIWIEPWTFFAHRSDIRKLILSGNKLSSIKSWTFHWLGNLEKLYLEDNQIAEFTADAFDWDTSNLHVHIDGNCLSDSIVWELTHILKIEPHKQKVCLAVDYIPNKSELDYWWTNWFVEANLILVWNSDWISKYIIQKNKIKFSDNTTEYFKVGDLAEQQANIQEEHWHDFDIINYPESHDFPATVDWIDNVPPALSWRSYDPELGTWSTWITATLYAYDTWVWIAEDWESWTCNITETNWYCTVYIEDILWNWITYTSNIGEKIDTTAPKISFNPSSWTWKSHTVRINWLDNDSWLSWEKYVIYKRQTWSNCWDFDGQYPIMLVPNWYYYDTTINDSNSSDWRYYLCVKENSLFDNAWNWNEAEQAGPFILDNTAPVCERSGLSTNSLEIWDTGNITLKCIDTWAWIQTMNLTSGDISFSGLVLRINNITTWSITDGIMYGIEFTAIGSWTTTITLKTNRVKDNADNWNIEWSPSAEISVTAVHGSQTTLIETWWLVTMDGPSWNWVDEEETIEINWHDWATWGYLIKYNNNTGIQWNNVSYTSSNGNEITLTFTDENTWNTFICAFGQTWWYITSICSQYPVKIDRSHPNVQLLWPTNWATFNLDDSIILSWSGSDWQSGISWYVLTITSPLGTNSFSWDSNFTWKTISLNKTWNRSRYVTAYDKTARNSVDTWTFTVQYNGWSGSTPVTWELVKLIDYPDWNWKQDQRITLNRTDWATWGYLFKNNNNTGDVNWQTWSYVPISSWAISFVITSENDNNNEKYICAFGQTWWHFKAICSQFPVRVDSENPDLSLDYPHPSVSYDFKKWTDIRFVWSWSDDRSGMSGYVFDVVSPSGVHDPHNFGSNTTAYTKYLNEAWRRYWYVTGYDNVNHQTYKSWSFYVSEDWDIPENWFYLISPALWTQISLWNDVVLSWQPGTVNSWYNRTVKKISWTTIATWTTTWLSATISSWEFTTWAYSWSVKDIATNTTKSISLFYVVDSSDAPDLEVNQFEFNEIEDADLDEYYSSNKITIRWLSDDWYTLAYLWSWIWALYINWEFVWTSGYVQNGDKINIEMKASDEYNETVKATLFVWMWSNTVSGDFKITTKDWIHDWDDPSLTPMQKLWWVLFVDNLVEMYQYDEEKLATFLSTFMQLLQDKSDYYASMIQEAEEDWDEELAQEYRLYKEAIDFLYLTVKYRYNHLDVEDRTIYIAPNGKQYLIEYDEDRMAYTSPDFSRPKYFPTWELLTNHIDLNNPAVWKWWIVWNVITTHNGKVYTIYEKNWKWTSSNFKTAKYFDTKEDIINHILANNPASDWDHRIDTDFDEVSYTAPNGKVYKIFKTSSKWNNPNMYSSYNFVDAKYFTSLDAAKKFIDQNNKK